MNYISLSFLNKYNKNEAYFPYALFSPTFVLEMEIQWNLILYNNYNT